MGGRCTTAQGGDAMDVDLGQMYLARPPCGQTHSDEKQAELMKDNKCFYCEIKGHWANVCRKKAANRAKQSEGTAAPWTTQMTAPNLVKYIQDNMGNLDEDSKINIIESLMLSGFVQGPN